MSLAIILAGFLFQATKAAAQTPTCEMTSSPVIAHTKANHYQINMSNLTDVAGGISDNAWRYAVINSAEQWNSASNGGWFAYDGETTISDLPSGSCNSSQSINLVRVAHFDPSISGFQVCEGNTAGRHNTRCNGTQWMVTLCASNANGPLNWSVGTIETGQLDVSSLLVHEFGHAIGLHHSNRTVTAQQSVMRNGMTAGTLRYRWLYPWDIECHERDWGVRSIKLGYRAQNSGTNAFTALTTAGSGFTQGSGMVRNNAGLQTWSTVGYNQVSGATRFRHANGSNLSGIVRDFKQPYVGHAYQTFWLPDLSGRWRTYYNYDYDSTNRYQNSLSKTNVYHYAYDYAYSSPPLQKKVSYCDHSPNIGCSPQRIYSAHPISLAYDTYSERTVYAWVHETRTYGAGSGAGELDREIRIAVGNRGSDAFTLNVPIRTGIYSATNVSLACGGLQTADLYDCLIAYTPLNSVEYGMRTRRFFVSTNGLDDYQINWDDTIYSVGWLNGSDIAAWYHNNKYWIAHKTGQFVRVREATDGANWTHHGSLGASVTAPQTATFIHPSNRMTRVYLSY